MSIISHWSDKLNWNKTWTSAILSRVRRGMRNKKKYKGERERDQEKWVENDGRRTEVLSAISLVALQYSVHRYLMSLPTPFFKFAPGVCSLFLRHYNKLKPRSI